VSFEVLSYMGLPLAKFARTHQFYPVLLVGYLLSILAMILSESAGASAMSDSSAGEGSPVPIINSVALFRSSNSNMPILYNVRTVKHRGGNNGKLHQRASAASCGAARCAVARGEVGSSDFRDRVFERFGSIPQINPTDPNRVGSFAAENGAGTKGEMGKGSERTEASSGSKPNGFGSCEAHHVRISPQEDRGGAEGEVGEGEGSPEEGGIELWTRGENDSSDLQTEQDVYAACNRGGKTRP
jgi:hypothetical protein